MYGFCLSLQGSWSPFRAWWLEFRDMGVGLGVPEGKQSQRYL